MSERIKKVNSLSQKIISEIIQKDINFSDSSVLVTVTEVKSSYDLKHAEVFVSILGNKEKIETNFDFLCRQLSKIQKIFASKIRLKYTPKLHLKLDESLDYAFHIDSIIKEIHLNSGKSSTK